VTSLKTPDLSKSRHFSLRATMYLSVFGNYNFGPAVFS
jgi:hypothetical protein